MSVRAHVEVHVPATGIYLDGCELRRVTQITPTPTSTVILERWSSHAEGDDGRIATLYRWVTDTLGRETDDTSVINTHFHLASNIGSVSLEIDDAGAVLSYEEYFPYGSTAFVAGESVTAGFRTLRFVGKDQDDSTGFYVFQFRYYAPFIGNWVSPDPVGEKDGLNRYAYCHGNPITHTDDLGLQDNGPLVVRSGVPIPQDEYTIETVTPETGEITFRGSRGGTMHQLPGFDIRGQVPPGSDATGALPSSGSASSPPLSSRASADAAGAVEADAPSRSDHATSRPRATPPTMPADGVPTEVVEATDAPHAGEVPEREITTSSGLRVVVPDARLGPDDTVPVDFGDAWSHHAQPVDEGRLESDLSAVVTGIQVARHDSEEGVPLDMRRPEDRALARDIVRRLRDSVMIEATARAASLRAHGDVARSAEELLRGYQEARAITLNEDTGYIRVASVGRDPRDARQTGNLYARYYAAAHDTGRTYLLGYGDRADTREGWLGYTDLNGRPRPEGGEYVDIAINPHFIKRSHEPGGLRRTAAELYGGGAGGLDRAITQTIAHELGIHAGRAAEGFPTEARAFDGAGHRLGGAHAYRDPGAPITGRDNEADVETHYLWTIFGLAPDSGQLTHDGGQQRIGDPSRWDPPVDPAWVPEPDPGTYRFERAPRP